MDLVVACPSCRRPFPFTEPLSFREECPACAADLHACRSCRFHDRYVENECREDQAEYVADKDKRNLCEYWKPKDDGGADDPAAAAKAKLNALFGGAKPTTAAPSSASSSGSAADEAKRKLDELFKKK